MNPVFTILPPKYDSLSADIEWCHILHFFFRFFVTGGCEGLMSNGLLPLINYSVVFHYFCDPLLLKWFDNNTSIFILQQ